METVKTSKVEVETRAGAIPDFSVVLVCWNNKSYLESCLVSLYQSVAQSTFDVVVVDNGSTDGSQEMLCRRFPRVKLIQNERNQGLAHASNQGIEATRGRHVLLLNNDTLVQEGALDAMVTFMDASPKAAAVGGRLVNPDGSFQAAFAEFSSLLQEFMIVTRLGELIWLGYPSHKQEGTFDIAGWLSSACLLLRRTALDEVGLLDEQYFIYGDETDLQFRLRRAGWQVCYLPEVETIHYGGRSMDRWRRRRMVYRGKMLFYEKNYGAKRTMSLRALTGGASVVKMAVWALAFIFTNRHERAKLELRSNMEVLKLCWQLE